MLRSPYGIVVVKLLSSVGNDVILDDVSHPIRTICGLFHHSG